MACMFNQHNVSVNGVPQAAPAAGAVCDCGEMVAPVPVTGGSFVPVHPHGTAAGSVGGPLRL